MATTSRRLQGLQGRTVFSRDFWELHRRLGECYEADMRRFSSTRGRSPQTRLMNVRDFKARASPLGVESVGVQPQRRALTETDGFATPSLTRLVHTPSLPGMPDDQGPSGATAKPERMHSVLLPSEEMPRMEPDEAQRVPQDEPARSGDLSLGSDLSPAVRFAAPHSCWLQKSSSVARRRSISKGEAFALSKTQASLHAPRCWLPALNPMGHFRNFWDFVGICLLAMDTIFLPVQFVTDDFFELFPALQLKSQIAVFYWFIDIILSFLTGYLDKGSLIEDHRLIAKRYLKSWFLPDIVVTSIDFVLMFLGEEGHTAQSAGTRILRLLRLCRVVRLGKLTRAAAFLLDKFESDVAYTQFTLSIAMLGMLLLEHVIACGWFGLGSMRRNDLTWISASKHEGSSFALLYSASLRWALAQLGIGGTQIEAVNVTEGAYTAVVALVSLLTFSTVISFMTSLIGTLQHKRMEETQQFGLLRRFLRTNKIPEDLRQRVTRFLQHAYSVRGANSEEPYILDLLSESLQAELQLARYYAKLFRNNFMSLQEEQVLQTIAGKAMTILETAEDDVIFCHGNPAAAAYYALDDCTMFYLQPNTAAMKAGSREWMSEMCLWTEWLHLGDLITSNFSKFIVIKSTEFCDIVSKAGPCQVQAHYYALEYVEALNEADEPSDLWSPPPKGMGRPAASNTDMENIFGQLSDAVGWTAAKVVPGPP